MRTRGQALVELLVAMIALVPLLFGIVWVAKVVDVRQATVAAARALAFECTVRVRACADPVAREVLVDEVRERFLAGPRAALRTGTTAADAPGAGRGEPFWTDRRGAPLIERIDDVGATIEAERFDSPLSFAAGPGEGLVSGASRLLSELAGPGRFGLDLQGGFVDASVRVDLARSRPEDGWVSALDAMPLSPSAHLAVLTDAWNASGPYGDAPDSVETRVSDGARLPGIDAAIALGYLPVRGLLVVADLLHFEPSAGDLRWHEIDVDLVPPDRIAPDATPPAEPAPTTPTDTRP